MNYSQWRKYADKKDISKITYVCGQESTLVELVLDDIKNILQVPATDYTSISAEDFSWDMISQYAMDPDANRLTLVRNADKINCWDSLEEWLSVSRNNPKNFVVFVSPLPDGPAITVKGKKVSYADHIELIRNKGKFIKCATPNFDDLVLWSQSYGLTEQTSKFLVSRVGSDVAVMYDTFKKLKAWNGPPNAKVIEILTQAKALESFVDYLILLDKKSAIQAISEVNPDNFGKIISHLDFRLDYMSDIYRCHIRRMYDNDIAEVTGIKIFLIKKFKPAVKDYDPAKVKFRRQLLTLIDGHVRSGAKTGVLESLVTLW